MEKTPKSESLLIIQKIDSEEVKNLQIELNKIIENLDDQLSAMEPDADYHHNIINLIANNPDSKELVQFIVDLHDRIETQHENFKDTIYESMTQMIHTKQKLIDKVFQKKKSFKDQTIDLLKFFTTPKGIGIIIIIIVSSVWAITYPVMFKSLILGIFAKAHVIPK